MRSPPCWTGPSMCRRPACSPTTTTSKSKTPRRCIRARERDSHGQLILRADGSFSYVPETSFLGTDSFTYKAVDHFNAGAPSRKP